ELELREGLAVRDLAGEVHALAELEGALEPLLLGHRLVEEERRRADREEVALEVRAEHLGVDLHHRPLGAAADGVAIADLLDGALGEEPRERLVEDLVEGRVRAVHELVLERAAELLDARPQRALRDARAVAHEQRGRDERARHEEVDEVVLVVVEREPPLVEDGVDRLLAGLVTLDELGVEEELERLVDHLLADGAGRVRDRGGDARALALELAEEADAHRLEIGATHAAPAMREEGGGDERGRRDDGDGVDLVGHAVRDALHERAPRGGGELVGAVAIEAVLEARLLHELVEAEHLAELHVEAAVARAEDRGGLEEPADVLLLLLLAGELAHVGLLLDDALVADADGHEAHLLAAEHEHGVDQHGEQAEFGREELARARAPALEEEPDAVALDEELAHVRVDEGRVELLPLEAAADEEGAAAAEDGAGREEAQVLARRDEG